MTSANNPKNQQPHGLGNLAQIIKDPCESMAYVPRKTIQCRDCKQSRIEPGSKMMVVYCMSFHQCRSADFPRQCANFLEA